MYGNARIRKELELSQSCRFGLQQEGHVTDDLVSYGNSVSISRVPGLCP